MVSPTVNVWDLFRTHSTHIYSLASPRLFDTPPFSQVSHLGGITVVHCKLPMTSTNWKTPPTRGRNWLQRQSKPGKESRRLQVIPLVSTIPLNMVPLVSKHTFLHMHPRSFDLAELVNDILPSGNRSRGSPLRPRETSDKLGKEFINRSLFSIHLAIDLFWRPPLAYGGLLQLLLQIFGARLKSNFIHHDIRRQEHDHSFRSQTPPRSACISVIAEYWVLEFVAIREKSASRPSSESLSQYKPWPNSILSTPRLFLSHNSSATVQVYLKDILMKTQMEEVEDDLAAEEENKLINEVGTRVVVL